MAKLVVTLTPGESLSCRNPSCKTGPSFTTSSPYRPDLWSRQSTDSNAETQTRGTCRMATSYNRARALAYAWSRVSPVSAGRYVRCTRSSMVIGVRLAQANDPSGRRPWCRVAGRTSPSNCRDYSPARSGPGYLCSGLDEHGIRIPSLDAGRKPRPRRLKPPTCAPEQSPRSPT